jgi:predicted secreted protein|tara:strand:+ start:37369 stop:37767 length:399 start_codon:yes stop_codon:yes gene_type:complete
MAEVGYTKVVSVKTTGSTLYVALPGSAASFDFSGEMLDITDFSSTGWRSRVRGLKDYSCSVTNFFGSTVAVMATLRSAILTGVSLDIRYLPDGTKGVQGRVLLESYNMSGDVGGVESLEISLPSDGTALTTL